MAIAEGLNGAAEVKKTVTIGATAALKVGCAFSLLLCCGGNDSGLQHLPPMYSQGGVASLSTLGESGDAQTIEAGPTIPVMGQSQTSWGINDANSAIKATIANEGQRHIFMIIKTQGSTETFPGVLD